MTVCGHGTHRQVCDKKSRVAMDSIILSNPIWLVWPEALMVALAVIYLTSTKWLASSDPPVMSRVRVMAIVGLLSSASLVLLGTRPNLFTIVAIPVIPAPFLFAALILSPRRITDWAKTRVYL